MPGCRPTLPKARTFIEASVALWRALGDQVGLALALANLGADRFIRGEFEEADSILSEGVALARASGDTLTLSSVLLSVGISEHARGHHERAAAFFRESLAAGQAVERASYRTWAVTRPLVYLGRTESERGASDLAMSLFREALEGMRESGLAGHFLATCLDWIAAEYGKAGDPLRAARLFGAADTQWQRARSQASSVP